MHQLVLPFQINEQATFSNFYCGRDQIALNGLLNLLEKENKGYIYLWGFKGTGCSHLLQACCQKMYEQKLSALYLPLQLLPELSPQIFESLTSYHLICIDDLQFIAGKNEWEESFFNFYNEVESNNTRLILSAKSIPHKIGIHLPDLVSRLNSGIIFQLHGLNDEEKLKALQVCAHRRGLDLSLEVAHYLVSHLPRDFSTLFRTLEDLDSASLVEQRKLTIPFIKRVLRI